MRIVAWEACGISWICILVRPRQNDNSLLKEQLAKALTSFILMSYPLWRENEGKGQVEMVIRL